MFLFIQKKKYLSNAATQAKNKSMIPSKAP